MTQLWNRLPTTTIIGGNLQRQVTAEALRNRDFDRAVELANRAVEANPNDFRERIWLVQVLMDSHRENDAEAAMRKAVDLARSEPDRWIALVQFLAQTKQMEKAEAALGDAIAVLKEQLPQGPLGLAQCCEVIGQTYRAISQNEKKTQTWYDAANQWYKAAQGTKSNDPVVTRRFIEFSLRSRQLQDAEAQLNKLLKNGASDARGS